MYMHLLTKMSPEYIFIDEKGVDVFKQESWERVRCRSQFCTRECMYKRARFSFI